MDKVKLDHIVYREISTLVDVYKSIMGNKKIEFEKKTMSR